MIIVLKEKGTENCCRYDKEDTGTKPACCCFTGIGITTAKLIIHFDTSYKPHHRANSINKFGGRVKIRGYHLGGFSNSGGTIPLGEYHLIGK